MSLVKPAALFVCVALAGCAGKTDSTASALKEGGAKPGAAQQVAQADKAKAPAVKPAAAVPAKAEGKPEAAARKVAEAPAEKAEKKLAAAGKEEKGGWWPFGGKDKAEQKSAEDKVAKKPEAAKVSQAWLDDHEKRLRAAVAGSKFEVERRGDVLVVVAPVDPSFNKDRPHMLLPVTLGPLTRVAKLVESDPLNAVLVLGHSDAGKDAALDRKLSLERAQAVASIFRMSGLRSDRLLLKGVGADKPRATNDSATGRAQNRRIELLLTRRDSLSAVLAQASR
ncbi:OmpA family protein [Pseudomonas sp. AN-1]|uniref:OmpA family protein n=1 Tax=Pseudomonas sp. AN-1 TaxID=3096605 RepID=UPI002A69C4E5|nr:OmpA family protein [Pseudomonas sp. AN-1]WPP45865.1 OmpA family protein [Pseudomonas sp. AN-1]